ncbi:hypothetical protein E2P63_02545 [Candidatus Bathyarchaeota archaeon]|nr:hypothetical protein E2P63_02545 [Candidatus Bathyarchaeota archaeon]
MTPKAGKLIVADLEKRSEKGLEFAKQMLQAEKIEYPKLRKALEHYLAHWSDFTHPGLFSTACEAVDGDLETVVPTQAAMAIISAAFDVHDDIIDKSETKHDVPTVYGKFGFEMALLLGNAFLIEGFKLFIDTTKTLSKKKGTMALEILKKLLFEVGNAHALEVGLKERKTVSPNDYMKIIEMKSAGIEADIVLGTLFGGGKTAEIEVSARLGRILGILVLLREEFIDVFEIEELRQRIAVHDLPLPLLFAMQDQEGRRKITSIVSKSKMTNSDLDKLLDIMLCSEHVGKLRNKMHLLIQEGLNLTKRVTNKRLRKRLKALISFMTKDL